MSIIEYFNKMKNLEEKLLNFLDQGDEESFENFIKIISDEKIRTNRHDLKTFLHLINKISSNYHHSGDFYNKIEKILKLMKDEIKQFFSNDEIFKIFKKGKRILLFLIEEDIFTIDRSIYNKMTYLIEMQYIEYFSFETKSFFEEDSQKKHYCLVKRFQEILKEDFEKFNEKRKKGENDDYLCEIIRNDLIEDFIIYVNKKNYPLDGCVEYSIFETNEFLLYQINTKLIEYAAFYGSNQIFKYLYKNNAQMTSNLMAYAIHGCDEEIIHILEENNYNIADVKYISESINCHHNYITNYILGKYRESEKYTDAEIINCILEDYLKYYNFNVVDIDKINYNNLFIYAIKYDYYKIVEILLSTMEIDINNEII